MKLSLIFALLSLTYLLTSSLRIEEKYFEGIITYDVETIILKESDYSDYLKERYGTTMKFYWSKNGNLLRKTFGNNVGLDYTLYLKEENTFYLKYKGIDTLYFYDGSVNDNEMIEIKESKSESILNQKCNKIEIKIKEKVSGKDFISEYHYSGSPKIDYKLYENVNDGFANLLYKKAKSPYLKLKIIFDELIMTYKARQIEIKEINDDIFILDTDLPRKQY